MNKKLSIVVISLLVLIIGGLSALLFLFYRQNKAISPAVETKAEEAKKAVVAEKIDTSGWKLYRNETFGYELKYPSDWVIGTTFGADPYSFSAPDFSPAKNYSDGLQTIPSFSISSIHKIDEGEMVEMGMPLGNPDGRIIKKQWIKIDGRDAFFVEYLKNGYGDPNGKVGRVQEQIKVIDSGVAYYIDMQEYTQDEKLLESSAAWENNATFQAILDSFHFLENNKVKITLSGVASKEIFYTNKDFGFSVALPEGWEKYQVSVQQDKGDDKHTYLYFLMPTTDKNAGYFDKKTGKVVKGLAEIFVITATDLATWNKDANSQECLENPNPSCPDVQGVIGKNSHYVFEASYGNGLLPKDVQKFVESGSAAKFLADKFKLLQ
jgi:hypothetical protein